MVPKLNGKLNKSSWDSFFHLSLELNSPPGNCAVLEAKMGLFDIAAAIEIAVGSCKIKLQYICCS